MSKGKPKKKLVKITSDDNKPLLNRKIKYKISDTEIGERRVKLSDMNLKVNPQKGRLIEKDVSCDSHFMMETIREIGTSIRSNYSFLPVSHPVYLFMDNAGGHGKTEVKHEYEIILKEEFNVLI